MERHWTEPVLGWMVWMSQPFFKILSVISNLIYFLLNQSATITNCWAFRSSRKGSLGSELLIKLLNILLKIEFYNGSHLMDEKNFDCMKCNKEAKHTHTPKNSCLFSLRSLPLFTHRQQIEFITFIYCYNWIFDFLTTKQTHIEFFPLFKQKMSSSSSFERIKYGNNLPGCSSSVHEKCNLSEPEPLPV